jgi:hypothetical protein
VNLAPLTLQAVLTPAGHVLLDSFQTKDAVNYHHPYSWALSLLSRVTGRSGVGHSIGRWHLPLKCVQHVCLGGGGFEVLLCSGNPQLSRKEL